MKKAISAATSAALLASLLATAVAPSALAAISQTSAGNVALGGTSTGTATLLFTENAIDALSVVALPATEHMYVTILDSAGLNKVSWAGTPVLSAPDSLGASISIVGNVLDIKITGRDALHVETISITGLKVKALSTAALGAVQIALTDTNGLLVAAAFTAASTITGTLVSPVGAGISAGVQVSNVTGCGFSTGSAVTFNTNGPDLRTPTAVGAVSSTLNQVIDFPVGAAAHLIGETIKQTVTCGLTSPATVTAHAVYSYSVTPTVYPGESNGLAGDLTVQEPAQYLSGGVLVSGGYLAKGTTLTFTIGTPGVVFSKVPTATFTDATTGTATFAGTVALSADRTTVTVTVTTASAGVGLLTLGSILYDVATTATPGSYVTVNLALSGGLVTDATAATNAIIFRGITASAPTPTVYIGENNQKTGLVTLTEQSAGFFNAGVGSNNALAVCQAGVNYTYTFAPYAKVTAGDLRLRDGSTASATNIVQATWDPGTSCYYWTVWTASTTASTIVIGNSDFTSGPLINVTVHQAPGIVAMQVRSGYLTQATGYNFDENLIATVPFAIATYRNQVAITALSQPVIAAGATDVKVGDIQVAETAYGQLKSLEYVCVEVLPRSNSDYYDTFLQGLVTADLPTVVASGGLVVGPVSTSTNGCSSTSAGLTGYIKSFNFRVLQQSVAGTGKLVIGNIHVSTTADAPAGPVLVNVWGLGLSNTQIDFQATISNAKIGVAPKLNIAANSALGLNPTSGYNAKTPKTQAVGKYLTWKFTGGKSLAGQRVNILVAKKFGGAWGGPVYLKSVWADANGIVTFAWTSKTAAAINVRVQWPGTTAFAVSTSKALGAYYK